MSLPDSRWLSDADEARLRSFIYWLLTALAGGIAISLVASFYAETLVMRRVGVLIGAVAIVAVTAWQLRHSVHRASMVLAAGFWGFTCINALMLSGVHSPSNILFPFVVMLAGWMLGVRWLTAWTVATLVFLVALAFAELQGWFIPSGRANPLVTIVTYMAVMPIVAFMTWSMRSILVEGRQQTQVLLREQEQKNQKLLQFEADMQAFMENMPAAVASFDLDSRLVRCNSRYAALFGSTPVALCGSITRDYVPGVVLEQITTQWELAYQGQEQSYLRFDINPLTKDITWVDCRLKPAYRDRQQVGLDAVLVDVTEKVQAAEKIRALNTELEQRVEQRTQELLNARSALQESRDELIRSQAKAGLSAMVASVSHELGTPLGNSVLVASTFVEITGELERMLTSGTLRKSNLLQTLQALKEGSDQLQSNLRRAELLLINFRQVSADPSASQ